MMKRIGPEGLFWHNAVVHALFAAFVLFRITRKPPPIKTPEDAELPYKPLP
jgi:hypothetical protein